MIKINKVTVKRGLKNNSLLLVMVIIVIFRGYFFVADTPIGGGTSFNSTLEAVDALASIQNRTTGGDLSNRG